MGGRDGPESLGAMGRNQWARWTEIPTATSGVLEAGDRIRRQHVHFLGVVRAPDPSSQRPRPRCRRRRNDVNADRPHAGRWAYLRAHLRAECTAANGRPVFIRLAAGCRPDATLVGQPVVGSGGLLHPLWFEQRHLDDRARHDPAGHVRAPELRSDIWRDGRAILAGQGRRSPGGCLRASGVSCPGSIDCNALGVGAGTALPRR